MVRSPFAMPQSWDATAQRWVDAIPREPIVEVGGLFEFAPVSRSDFVGVGSRQIWLFDQHGRRTFLDELAVPTVITNEDIPVVVQGMSSRCRTSTPVVVANRVDARLIWRDTEWRITKLPTVRPVCVAVRGSSFAVCHSNGMTSVSDDWGETWQERPGVPSLGRSGQIALLPYPRPDPSRVIPVIDGAVLEYANGEVVFVSVAGEERVGEGALMAVEDQWAYLNTAEGIQAFLIPR